jgi:cell division protein FtsB
MHGGENESANGDWHNAVESTAGSMGGESDNGAVRVFVVMEGAGKDMCCGQVGPKGPRFCTSAPSDCKFKTHVDKKAKVKPFHVYLGSDGGKRSSGWLGWCMPVEVFGGSGRAAQLAALGLDGQQFRRFGETLSGLHAGGKVEMASVPWDPILEEIKRPLDYGATPRKVRFHMNDQGVIESTGLSNWMTLDTPQSPTAGEDGVEGSLDRSAENDHQVLEKMTTMSANSEVLKAAVEQLSSDAGKTSGELGDHLTRLGSQIHDVSVRVGYNPGFVGNTHDSVWTGITLIQEQLDQQEGKLAHQIPIVLKEKIQDIATALGAEAKVEHEKQSREAVERRFDLQLKELQALTQGLSTTVTSQAADLRELKQDRSSLKQEMTGLKQELTGLRQELKTLKQDTQRSIPTSFGADWKLVFDFFIRNTKAGTVAGGVIEDAAASNSSDIQKLFVDLGNVTLNGMAGPSLTNHLAGGGQAAPGMTAAAGALATLETQVLDLKARMASKAVTIGDFTFPTLAGTCAWAKANLPSSADHALICLDVVALLQSIGSDFAAVDETRDTMYQNKRAGVSTMALNVSSSFHAVLPQIMGRKRGSLTGEDSGLVLPCASKHAEWFDNLSGVTTGVKARIEEGLSTQTAACEEAIRELAYTHPVGAAMASRMLQRSCAFAAKLLGLMETMWNECSGRSGEVQPSEAWLVICAMVRQLFRELRDVRRPGAAVTPGSSASIGTIWWHVLQTHRLMDEFMAKDIRRHPSIIPVFTAHLDRHRVTLSTHATLVAQVKRIETAVGVVTASVNRLNGARGNAAGGRGGRGGAGTADNGAPL